MRRLIGYLTENCCAGVPASLAPPATPCASGREAARSEYLDERSRNPSQTCQGHRDGIARDRRSADSRLDRCVHGAFLLRWTAVGPTRAGWRGNVRRRCAPALAGGRSAASLGRAAGRPWWRTRNRMRSGRAPAPCTVSPRLRRRSSGGAAMSTPIGSARRSPSARHASSRRSARPAPPFWSSDCRPIGRAHRRSRDETPSCPRQRR